MASFTVLETRQFPVAMGDNSVAAGSLVIFRIPDGRVFSVTIRNLAPSQAQIDTAVTEFIKTRRLG